MQAADYDREHGNDEDDREDDFEEGEYDDELERDEQGEYGDEDFEGTRTTRESDQGESLSKTKLGQKDYMRRA